GAEENMFRKLMVLLAAPVVLGAQQVTDTTLHPISLAEAIRLAGEKNVSNILASNSVRTANNSVRSARAAFIPQVTASAGQARTSGDRLGPGQTIIGAASAWTYNTGLAINNFTLFDGGAMFANIKTANANVAAAEAGEVNTEFAVALQVKLAYNAI